MSEELSLSQIHQRLVNEIGIRISRQYLTQLVKEGRGPAYRLGPIMFGKRIVLIKFDDAMTWLEGTAFRPRDNYVEQLHDQIILYLRDRLPDEWRAITKKIVGQERLDKLNAIANEAIQLAEQRCREIAIGE